MLSPVLPPQVTSMSSVHAPTVAASTPHIVDANTDMKCVTYTDPANGKVIMRQMCSAHVHLLEVLGRQRYAIICACELNALPSGMLV